MDKIIIAKNDSEMISLMLRDGEPFRLAGGPAGDEPSVGDIFRARVEKVNKSLKSVFVNLGEGCQGYMNADEEDMLRPGDEINVQVTQEAFGKKVPTVSREISIPGEWLVLTSDPGFLAFSRRSVYDGPAREEIHQMLSPWFSDCGFIIRTAAEQADLNMIEEEAAKLHQTFINLQKRLEHSAAPSCLFRGQSIYREWLQNADKKETEVVTDNPDIYEEIKNYYRALGIPDGGVRYYQEDSPSLSNLYHFEKIKKEALEKTVWLKSGAYLVIERTEALTVIDVNSGKSEVSAGNTAEAINREAAREVARQLVLRNLGGMILVDFINMKKKESEEELLNYLRSLTKEDSVYTQVVDITPLGLVEITRRRVRRPFQTG